MPSFLKLSNLLDYSKIFDFLLVLALLHLPTSCSSSVERNNKMFLKKYGNEIDNIHRHREQAASNYTDDLNPQKRIDNSWATPAKSMGIDGTFSLRSAYIDTSKIKPGKRPEEFLPNLETFIKGKEFQSTIPEIYDVTYNLENYPKSYKIRTVSFDDIAIPQNDYFGIKSTLGKKQYTIVDRKILRENVDYINNYFDPETREINLILLKEKEQIRNRKKASMLLGKEFDDEEKQKEEDKKKAETKLKEEIEKKEKEAKEAASGQTEESNLN